MLPFSIYFLHMEFARQSCPIRRIDSSTFRCNLSSRPSFQSSLRLLRFFSTGIRRFASWNSSIPLDGRLDLSTELFVGTVSRYPRRVPRNRSKWFWEMDVPARRSKWLKSSPWSISRLSFLSCSSFSSGVNNCCKCTGWICSFTG